MTDSSFTKAPTPSRRGLIIGCITAVLVVGAIALDTKIVKKGSSLDVGQQAFSPADFGAKTFPVIAGFAEKNALNPAGIAPEILADKAKAAGTYGVKTSTGTIIPITFTATVLEGQSGIYTLNIDGMPPDVKVRMQTGPAINGTDLRDSTGDIAFGQFKNQIEYQNAGSGINQAMKQAILTGLPPLTGKTVDVTGVFRLGNPKNWLVTPVRIVVK